MKKKEPYWIMVRERCISKTPDWKACATYVKVKEFLSVDGQWYRATNSAKRFNRDECKAMGRLPYGQYFERGEGKVANE